MGRPGGALKEAQRNTRLFIFFVLTYLSERRHLITNRIRLPRGTPQKTIATSQSSTPWSIIIWTAKFMAGRWQGYAVLLAAALLGRDSIAWALLRISRWEDFRPSYPSLFAFPLPPEFIWIELRTDYIFISDQFTLDRNRPSVRITHQWPRFNQKKNAFTCMSPACEYDLPMLVSQRACTNISANA
ncbi:hypothetical protein ACLOJK_013505 [Asimina triloba]